MLLSQCTAIESCRTFSRSAQQRWPGRLSAQPYRPPLHLELTELRSSDLQRSNALSILNCNLLFVVFFVAAMRLLRAMDFAFKEFIGKNIPNYAIISHRWSDDEEVSYQDFIERSEEVVQGRCPCYGWTKIAKAAELTLQFNLEWFWIDTCRRLPTLRFWDTPQGADFVFPGCIDKKSSAELSEAINSMFKWYRDST